MTQPTLGIAGAAVRSLTFAVQVIDPVLVFEVHGLPVTQGSKRLVTTKRGRTLLIEDRAATLRPWRESVASCAQQAVMVARQAGYDPPFDGPIFLGIEFRLPRPASRPKRDQFPDRKPDLDKLRRAVGDALKGTAYVDDSRIVRAWDAKDYGLPGARITVARLYQGQR